MSKKEQSKQHPPGPGDFVILLVEDTGDLRRDVKRLLDEIDGVYVVEAGTLDEARSLIDRHYIDAAIVDLGLPEGKMAGLRVLDKLRERSGNAPVVIWSQFSEAEDEFPRLIGREQVIGTVDKEERNDELVKKIDPIVQEWREREVSVVNGRLVLDLLWKRKEKGSYNLRGTQRELNRELDRVYRQLFGAVRGIEGRDTEITVTFRPIEREGLSSAVTVEGEVTIGRDANGKAVAGNRCVVKIGPVREIEQEVDRYTEFVKFGVRLAQRVELLGSVSENLIGGIAYSFAGGVFGPSMTSFDELLKHREGWHLAADAIKRLFDPKAKDWYGVRCEDLSPRDYMTDTYRTDFRHCFTELVKSLEGLQRKYGFTLSEPRSGKAGRFRIPGAELLIPPTNIRGANSLAPEREACLVHGDMHGGNVMVELGREDHEAGAGSYKPSRLEEFELKRICLIDYRSAGPGPRAVDAVALQISIRLADAAAIATKYSQDPKKTDPVDLKGKALGAAVAEAANRVQGEADWLRKAWEAKPNGESVAGDRSPQWAIASSLLTARMRFTFPEITLEEYLPIAMLSLIRQFGYGVGPLVRVRLLAWLSALYSAGELGD